jgi:hypothetical protein
MSVSLLTTAPDASISTHQNVKRAFPEFRRAALRKQLAAMRQNPETTEFDRRRGLRNRFQINRPPASSRIASRL